MNKIPYDINNLPILNIGNSKRHVYCFCRDKEGKRLVIEDKNFYPFYFEKTSEPDSQYISYDGKPLRKVFVSNPGEVSKNRSSSSYSSDIKFTTNYLIHKVDDIVKAPIKFMFLDIEVMSKEMSNPADAKYPVSCITIFNSFSKEYKTWYLGEWKNETLMLDNFVSYLKEESFDIWLSWNSSYDYNYLWNRIEKFSERISPVGLSRYGENRDILYPTGISIIDYLRWFKKIHMREASYTLDYIGQKHLGKGKEFGKVDFSVLSDRLRQHNVEDVELLVELENKYQIIPYFDEIRRLSKCQFEDLYHNSRVVESLIFQEAKKQNVVLPNKPQVDEDEEETTFEGATRDISQCGLYEGVGEFDLSGAYPMMILNFCLDPANITTKTKDTIEVNGVHFKQNNRTMFPLVVERMLVLKDRIKKEKDANPEDKYLAIKYDAIKGIVNSVYGVIALRYFRLFNTQVASSITYLVRDLLMYVKEKVELKGMKVIQWDTDSCAKDTPVIIKQNNTIEIIPIEDLYQSPLTSTSLKEINICDKNIEILTDEGWSKIKYIYRHKTPKVMYRLITRKGFCEISEDHSLIIDNKCISPKELKKGDKIDLIKYPPIYNSNVLDVDFAWVLGFFVAEGTCNTYHGENYGGLKYGWRIVNQDKSLLIKASKILGKFGFKTIIHDFRKSSSIYALDPIDCRKEISLLFQHWCLTKTKNKKIPFFILSSDKSSKESFLKGYFDGDGHKDKNGVITYTTTDKSLAQGICFILNSLNIEYSLDTRTDKLNVIVIRLIKNANCSRIKEYDTIKEITKYNQKDYIYDIETENHHFCGGIGNVLLHNSIFLNTKEDITEVLNGYIKQWALEKYGKKDISLVFERKGWYTSLFILGSCHYHGYLYGKKDPVIKGIEGKRASSSKFEGGFQLKLLDSIHKKSTKTQIEHWITSEIERFKTLPLEDIAFPAKVGTKVYKNLPIFMRALTNTKRVKKNFNPLKGELFFYLFLNTGKNEVIAFTENDKDFID
ncbi:hypothetical protein M0R19_09085, partial [Candidatus Pacearchaeota archaeon]|nr:hypothetical protein [Candidatus Pacearchaeota archaeon]